MKEYKIDIAESGLTNINTYRGNFGINIFQYEDSFDTTRENYYFDSIYTDKKYDEITNKYINNFLLEVLNGVRICNGYHQCKPFNSSPFSLEQQINAYNIISSINYNTSGTLESTGDKTLKIALESQTMRDIFVLLNRVTNLDENTFVNMYRIRDSAESLHKIIQYLKHNLNLGSSDDLFQAIKKLKKHDQHANNYMEVGIIARHGSTLGISNKGAFEQEKLYQDTLNVVRKMTNFFINNPYYTFEILLTHYHIKRKTAKK